MERVRAFLLDRRGILVAVAGVISTLIAFADGAPFVWPDAPTAEASE